MTRYIDLTNEQESMIVICAIRYSLGRNTYMPAHIIGLLKYRIDIMADNTLRIISRDISCFMEEQKRTQHKVASDIIRDWESFKEDIDSEINRRTENGNRTGT